MQEYLEHSPFRTPDGWHFYLPNMNFQEGMSRMLGLRRDAFQTNLANQHINEFSISVEMRINWNKCSNLILGLAELAQRLRIFPMMHNVMDRHPIIIQNVQSYQKSMDAANGNSVKYAITVKEFSDQQWSATRLIPQWND